VKTLYIVPTWGDQGSQCRIVARDGDHQARESYEANPSNWREVGLMDWHGNVRCIEPEFAALRDDVPLMAGTQFKFGGDDAAK